MSTVGRRDFLRKLFSPVKALTEAHQEAAERALAPPAASPPVDEAQDLKAVIQGRFCLAYQKSFCTTCSERCPEEGAIVIENHIPRVVADNCTGCGVCHEVCPAPRNAILMIKAAPSP